MLDGDEGEFVDCALASRVFRKLNLRDAEDEGEQRSIRVDVRGVAATHEVVGDGPADRARRLASGLSESRVLAATKQWTQARREEIVDLLVVGRCAHFPIYDDDGEIAAYGAYPHFALLEHSCAPSVEASYANLEACSTARAHAGRSAEQRWHATRPLGVGEFVTRAYEGVDLAAPRADRRAALLARYGVLCACSRCDAEEHPDAARAKVARNDAREAEKRRLREAAAAREKTEQDDWMKAMDARYGGDRPQATANKIAALKEAQRRAAPGTRPAPRPRKQPEPDSDDDGIAGLP